MGERPAFIAASPGPEVSVPHPDQVRPVTLALSRLASRGDEVEDLLALLLEQASPDAGHPAEIEAMARLVAVASLGDNHLWQDLQLPSRRELTALMTHWFAPLAARNNQDMKWKKFLYKQLCEREALFICKAPSCAVCSDRPKCFGPEEG